MADFISLGADNIDGEHICCAFSDKKCVEGTLLKKEWLKKQFAEGYVFRRLDERAKVFIEYCPSEIAWCPITAPDYLFVGCLWVAGQYKGNGYAKTLLQFAIDDAKRLHKRGLVTVVGKKKYHFMSDGKWFLKQGFKLIDVTDTGFCLLVLNFENEIPQQVAFNDIAKRGTTHQEADVVVYYSNRCPFTEYHVREVLPQTIEKQGLSLQIIKLTDIEMAQSCPSPATIFSLFYKGKFITTDVSTCLEDKFKKVILL